MTVKSEGLDIGFFEDVNRRMAAVYAALFVSATSAAVGAAVLSLFVASVGPLLAALAAFVVGVVALGVLRAGLVGRRARAEADAVSDHCARGGLTQSEVDAMLGEHDLPFVADLFARHGARYGAALDVEPCEAPDGAAAVKENFP